MKIKYYNARFISLIICLLSIIPFALAYCSEPKLLYGIIGFVLLVVGVVILFKYYRCPHCGEFLGRDEMGKCCPHCGKALEKE